MLSPPKTLLEDSHQTWEAFAQVIRAVAPEVCGLSVHDQAAETLWMSEDFLLPEDHQLVGALLAGDPSGAPEFIFGRCEARIQSLAIAVRNTDREVTGALRLSIDSQIADARLAEPLTVRLAPMLACVAAELERSRAVPSLPPSDTARWAEIDRALDASSFDLFLQPIRSLRDDPGMPRYEVLLRLRTADGELVEPGEFFRSAAHKSLMPTMDRWVLRTLLVWLVNHRKLWLRRPAVFSINLAAQSLTDANFVGYVESCVQKSGLPPQALCFEVTERFAASGNISVAESLKRLEALGCDVALDHFGANAPSYGYLRTVPAHYFKIDGSLVLAAPTDRIARAVIASIVRMASDLGVQTVAESVESDRALQAVRGLGVDFAQGFLFGRPKSLEGYDFAKN